jgi:hypothetical protein
MLILLFAYFFHTGRSGPVYVSEVRDPAGQFRLLDTGRLDAPLSLPDELRTRVASVLAKKGISELESLSPQLEAMRAKSATLAAPQIDPDKLMALRPMNSSVATNRPLFQWTRPGGATSFLFTVKNDSGFSWQTNVMNATNLVLPQASASLPEGQMFTWQVETRIGRSLSVSAPAWFYVLNATSAAELHRRELDLAGSPLALGTLYAAYGLLDEAEAQFHRVLSLNTNHPVAMTVLDQLARRRGRGP